MKKEKQIRALKNAIFNVPGDKSSGLLQITDLTSAQTFLNRFNDGVYLISDPAEIADLTGGKHPAILNRNGRNKVFVTPNPDGTMTIPEVWVKQGNGYDYYVNGVGGYMRKDTPKLFDPQALGKIALVTLEALHSHAASENEATATDANRVLGVLREYDNVAAEAARQRQAADKRAKALKAMTDAGVSTTDAEAILNRANGVETPATVEPAPADVNTEVPSNKKAKKNKDVATV